jgi:ERCC4-type nuclease
MIGHSLLANVTGVASASGAAVGSAAGSDSGWQPANRSSELMAASDANEKKAKRIKDSFTKVNGE